MSTILEKTQICKKICYINLNLELYIHYVREKFLLRIVKNWNPVLRPDIMQYVDHIRTPISGN